ncbi:hypothetical protein SAY87_013500 [Trapa incisa]|uniref:Uncharacterized protein n=1 Tax=Trapa incisa TaxID=236973 RepID=A0AAN7KIE3_9MYRT|nr:hypothetical protein SAY87_013500 [Trapa incisa]
MEAANRPISSPRLTPRLAVAAPANSYGDDAFGRLYATFESEMGSATQNIILENIERATVQRRRATSFGRNAEILLTNAPLLERVLNLHKQSLKKVLPDLEDEKRFQGSLAVKEDNCGNTMAEKRLAHENKFAENSKEEVVRERIKGAIKP